MNQIQWLEKIADLELRDFVTEDASPIEKRSVIIEANTKIEPLRKIRLSEIPRNIPHSGRASGKVDSKSDKSQLDELCDNIQALKPAQKVVRLDSANAVIIELTAGQLAEIARSNSVFAIRPNRVHRVPRQSARVAE